MPDGKYKDDDFYKANATIAYYRQKLNPVLEAKDKAGWDVPPVSESEICTGRTVAGYQ